MLDGYRRQVEMSSMEIERHVRITSNEQKIFTSRVNQKQIFSFENRSNRRPNTFDEQIKPRARTIPGTIIIKKSFMLSISLMHNAFSKTLLLFHYVT